MFAAIAFIAVGVLCLLGTGLLFYLAGAALIPANATLYKISAVISFIFAVYSFIGASIVQLLHQTAQRSDQLVKQMAEQLTMMQRLLESRGIMPKTTEESHGGAP